MALEWTIVSLTEFQYVEKGANNFVSGSPHSHHSFVGSVRNCICLRLPVLPHVLYTRVCEKNFPLQECAYARLTRSGIVNIHAKFHLNRNLKSDCKTTTTVLRALCPELPR